MKTDFIKRIKAEVGFGFSTNSFIDFSTSNLEYIEKGLVNLADGHSLPFIILQKTNSLYNKENFIISPICFSGPSYFEMSEFYEIVQEQLKSFNIKGGFIQTRDSLPIKTAKVVYNWGAVFIDTRTNYRFYLNQTDDIILKMKRDSRTRIRKLLKNKDEFSVSIADSKYEINIFLNLYLNNAKKNGYSKLYLFSNDSWYKLLESDDFNLFLLKYKGEIVSGTVISTIYDAFDYTFMAYSSIIKDISRANLYFIYKMLNDKGAYLDLGGGITENDSLSKFKLSMGGRPTPFKRYRFLFNSKEIIFDKNHFKHLMTIWP
tara:strand:+ start:144 stop:1094 length:951 start_codon:yes stop_codon:yes gene_type:complete